MFCFGCSRVVASHPFFRKCSCFALHLSKVTLYERLGRFPTRCMYLCSYSQLHHCFRSPSYFSNMFGCLQKKFNLRLHLKQSKSFICTCTSTIKLLQNKVRNYLHSVLDMFENVSCLCIGWCWHQDLCWTSCIHYLLSVSCHIISSNLEEITSHLVLIGGCFSWCCDG